MSKYRRKGISEFANAINDVLIEYGHDIHAEMCDIVPKVARDCSKRIRKDAPRRIEPTEKEKKYFQSFKVKTREEGAKYSAIVYSDQPGLPHLLENGHMTRSGTMTREFKHIAPAAQNAAKELQQRLEKSISHI